jgi:hypothetical protein
LTEVGEHRRDLLHGGDSRHSTAGTADADNGAPTAGPSYADDPSGDADDSWRLSATYANLRGAGWR